jgi:hypothetical protein
MRIRGRSWRYSIQFDAKAPQLQRNAIIDPTYEAQLAALANSAFVLDHLHLVL